MSQQQLKSNEVLIRVGHSAYRGQNGMRLCFSKAQAIRVLLNRGYSRATARITINNILQKDSGYETLSINGSVTEVNNEKWAYNEKHYCEKYSKLKSMWKNQSEF